MFSIILSSLILSLLPLQESQLQYRTVPPKENDRCIVCGVPLTEEDVVLIVRGRRVPLNRAMVDSFMNNKTHYFAKLQPKGALVQENLEAPEGTAQGGISFGWFLFGAYVLVALLFAGLSGYHAVSKGLSAIPHFFIGLFLSAFGYLYVLTRPSQVEKDTIPPGLARVPDTHAPVGCPKCGNENHPSASKCAGCGAELQPLYESEVTRVRS